MKRHIFNSIDVKTFRTDFIDCKPEYNTFFELVFVEKGKGHRISGHLKLPFKENDFFLHLPNELNSIHLEARSVIHFIKFQKVLFSRSNMVDFSVSDWFSNIEFILNSNHQNRQTIVNNGQELAVIRDIIHLLTYEISLQAVEKAINLKSLLVLLLNVVKRNMETTSLANKPSSKSNSIQDILNYIHLHIGKPGKLSVRNLANRFCISEKYFSEYFLAHAGISYKQYVLEYKVKSAETRIRYSNLTLSQIASELGFTDLSHLNKTFKNIRGMYPRDLRKQN